MIVTITPNPAFDLTTTLNKPLVPGAVQQSSATTIQAGGKGINVATVCASCAPSVSVTAISPANASFKELLSDVPQRCDLIDVPEIRTNITIASYPTESEDTTAAETTKINHAGFTPSPELLTAYQNALSRTLSASSTDSATWVSFNGSLPPGTPEHWYTQSIKYVKGLGYSPLIAVDTSGAGLKALLDDSENLPTLIKPNSEELADLNGTPEQDFEAQVEDGDFTAILQASQRIHEQGVPWLLVSLGGAGALLSTPKHCWFAQSPRVDVKSTVGAGDSMLAGFMLAQSSRADLPESLIQAVRFGSTAVTLPGTTLPTPETLITDEIRCTQIL